MSIVYLVPGNMTGGPYGLKELKRREKLLKDWSFNPSKVKVYDVVGAGDTFLAALTYGYLKTEGDMSRALSLANKAAAVAVQNQGTYVLQQKDVEKICNRR